MELPVDPLVHRAVVLLRAKSPDSPRQLLDLMAEHNNMTVTLVDVWTDPAKYAAERSLITAPQKTSAAPTSAQPVGDDSERPNQLASSRLPKRDGHPKSRTDLFSPDPAPVPRLDGKVKASPITEAPKISLEASEAPSKTDGSTALFSVPDNVRKRSSASSSPAPSDGQDANRSGSDKRPTNRLKVPPKGYMKAAPGRSSPHLPVKDGKASSSSASSGPSKSQSKTSASAPPRQSSTSLTDEESSSSPLSHSSAGTVSPLGLSTTGDEKKANGDDSGSDSDVISLHSSAERQSRNWKRGHVVIASSSEDEDEDAGNGLSAAAAAGGKGRKNSARRTGLPPRKCKPGADNAFDGMELSSSDSGDDMEGSREDEMSRSLPTSPSNGLSFSSSSSGSSLNRSLPSNLKLPLKPSASGARSAGTPQTPDGAMRPAPPTPTGLGSRPFFSTQTSRPGSTSSGGPTRHLSTSGSRKIEAMKKQAKKMSSQVRVIRK